MSEKMSHWEVRGSLPPVYDGKNEWTRTWRQNVQLHVVALTLERSIALTREKYPTIEMHVAQKHGFIDYIADDATKGTP